MTYEQAKEFLEWCATHRKYVERKDQWPKYNQAIKIIKETK